MNVGALSHISTKTTTLKAHLMPAKDFLTQFPFDPATFNFETFREKLVAEIDSDTDLSTAALTQATTERDTLAQNERELKIKLFDATIAKQGTPVAPKDSPASSAETTSTPTVPDSDIFEKVE